MILEPIEAFAALVILSLAGLVSIGVVSLVFLAIIGPILAFYFLPAIIAIFRKHEHRWWILGLNAFFGGTGIGWIALIIWAIVGDPESKDNSLLIEHAEEQAKEKKNEEKSKD